MQYYVYVKETQTDETRGDREDERQITNLRR